MSKKPQVQVHQYIKGPRSKVFAAWIRPELAVQWFSPMELKPVSFRSDAKVGGGYQHVMTGDPGTFTTVGRYLEIKQDEKLVFTWGAPGEKEPDSVVTVEFRDHMEGTMVTLTQEKLPQDLVDSHQSGWESALEHLSHFFANQ